MPQKRNTAYTSSRKPLYSPINSHKGQIRVIVLAPGIYSDDLVVHLRTRTLSQHKSRPNPVAKYEALSYVWGQEICERKAIVSGKAVTITENLDCALRHLRLGSQYRTLWVDALCINQDDTVERSHQVQLMRRIFKVAWNVIAWLGPAEETGHDELFSHMRRNEIPRRREDHTNPHIREYQVLLAILNRPWFTRVWVVQELALASNDPLVHVGRDTVLWSRFYHYAIRLHVAAEWEYLVQRHSKQTDDSSPPPSELLTRIIALHDIRTTALKKQGTFEYSMELTKHCFATDPRDVIFGVLGVSRRSTWPILPDYSKTVQRVFSEVSAALMPNLLPEAYFYDFFLGFREGHGRGDIVRDLPSWAVDFTMRGDDGGNRYVIDNGSSPRIIPTRRSFLTRPSNALELVSGLGPVARFSEDYKILYTSGVLIGTIVAILPGQRGEFQPITADNGEVMLPITTMHKFYQTFAKPRGIPWGRLFKATFGWNAGDPKSFAGIEKQALVDPCEEEDEQRRSNRPYELLPCYRYKHHEDREATLFITDKGHLGRINHKDLSNRGRVGDIVVGLFARNTPFVLRSVAGGYQMIGAPFQEDFKIGRQAFLPNEALDAKWKGGEELGREEYAIV